MHFKGFALLLEFGDKFNLAGDIGFRTLTFDNLESKPLGQWVKGHRLGPGRWMPARE